MNMASNDIDSKGMLFDQAWIVAGAGAAAAVVSVAVLGVAVGLAVRGRSAPRRYGLLLAALFALGIGPAVDEASAGQAKPTKAYKPGIGPTFSDISDAERQSRRPRKRCQPSPSGEVPGFCGTGEHHAFQDHALLQSCLRRLAS